MSRLKEARPLNVTPGKPLLILIILFLTGVANQQCSEFFDPQIKNYILLVYVSVSNRDWVIGWRLATDSAVRDSNPGRARDSVFSNTL